MNPINHKIKQLRQSHQLTVAKMAELIGVSPGNISDWETGKKKSTPTSKALIAIAQQFNVSLDWLMTDVEPEHSSPLFSHPIIRSIDELAGQLTEQDLLLLQSMASHLVGKNQSELSARDAFRQQALQSDVIRERSLAAEYFVKLPLVGKVTAGAPIMAVENIEEYINVPSSMVGSGHHFLLRVQGDSMIDKDIRSGDLVIIRQQPDADNGDIVAALIEREDATLKSFYREKDAIRLQPANPAYRPILSKQIEILGKAVGIIRNSE